MNGILRPYQQDAIRAMEDDHAQHRRILLSLPTGSGKTLTAAHYVDRCFLRRGRRPVLWIAHNDELLEQAYETFRDRLRVSSDEMCRRHGHWLKRKRNHGAAIWFLNNSVQEGPSCCALLVIDEAHRAAGDTYTRWMSKCRAFATNGARLLGLTATPYRRHEGEIEPLTSFTFSRPKVRLFEKVSFERSFNDLVAAGYIAPFKHWPVESNLRFDMRLRDGDVAPESLSELNNPLRNRFIINLWREGRDIFGPTLIFVGTRDHARNLAQAFGPDAEYAVSGDAEDRQRRDLAIKRFRSGQLPVLVNAGIFREGVDVPHIRTVILARPTTSPGFFTQMVGRGARLDPDSGKEFFYLVDVHDQLGAFESYLCGIEVLGGGGQVDRAARARGEFAESITGSSVGELLHDRRIVMELVLAMSSPRTYQGWITFRGPDGERILLGALLTTDEYHELLRVAVAEASVPAASAEAVGTAARILGSRALGVCARALRDGLAGHLRSFRDLDGPASDLLRQAPLALKVPAGDALRAVAAVVREAEDRARDWGIPEREIAETLGSYLATPGAYGGVVRLVGDDGVPHLRLLSAWSWAVVSEAIDRAVRRQLTFSDAPEILARLTALEPDLSDRGREVFASIAASRNADDAAVALEPPSTKPCRRCGALFPLADDLRFCGYCGEAV